MTPAGRPAKTLRRSAGYGAAAAFACFWLLLTYGRPWDLLPNETLGNFYDAQAESFTEGRLDVDPDELSFEGFRIGDKTYEYQGPVPALLRLPVAWASDDYTGRLTRVSMLAAFALALTFVVKLQLLAREVVRPAAPVGPGERLLTGLVSFGLGASSLLFLASKAWVYHEALLWGVAFSLGSFAHLGRWLAVRSGPGERWWGDRQVVLAGVFAGLALLTRSSVGAGPMAALVLVGSVQFLAWAGGRSGAPRWLGRVARAAGWRRSSLAGFAVLVLGVLVPVGAYAAVNHAKFGTLFSLPAEKQVLVQFDETRQEFFASNDGSLFGAKFIPSVAAQALRPDALAIGGPFPYVAFPRERPSPVGDVLFAERDWSSSLPSSEPVAFLLALLGVAALLAPKRLAAAGDVAVLRLPVVAAAAGGFGFFAIGYIANRYLSDLFPLVALGAVIGAQVAVTRLGSAGPALRRAGAAVIALLALWGAWANLGLGLEYQRVIAPGTSSAQRAEWLHTQVRFGPSPGVIRIDEREHLPDDPALGVVAVIGDCDALYRSNGAIWLPLEGGAAAGRFSGSLRLDGPVVRPIALVTSAEGGRLVLEPVAEGVVRFVAEVVADGRTTRSLPGPAVELPLYRPVPVDITFDWRSGYAEVRQGEDELLAANIALPTGRPQVDPGFAGTLRVDPPSDSVCRALAR